MSSTEDFRLAVRLVILDVEELVDEIDTTDVSTRRGVENLFESQLAALRHVDQELGKVRLNQRLRALTQATVGVLPTLLTSVERSNRDTLLPAVGKCRQSINALTGHLF